MCIHVSIYIDNYRIKIRSVSDYKKMYGRKNKPILKVFPKMKENYKGKRKPPTSVSSSMLNLFGGKRIVVNSRQIVAPDTKTVENIPYRALFKI